MENAFEAESGSDADADAMQLAVDVGAPFRAKMVRPDGKPKPLTYELARAVQPVAGPALPWVGTFATLGWPKAVEKDNHLIMGGCFFAASCITSNAVMVWLCVQPKYQQLLGKLGVSERLVTAERWKEAESYIKLASWTQFCASQAPFFVAATVCVVYGFGAQESKDYNRVSALLLVFLFAFVN
jgi:hypothetical protein